MNTVFDNSSLSPFARWERLSSSLLSRVFSQQSFSPWILNLSWAFSGWTVFPNFLDPWMTLSLFCPSSLYCLFAIPSFLLFSLFSIWSFYFEFLPHDVHEVDVVLFHFFDFICIADLNSAIQLLYLLFYLTTLNNENKLSYLGLLKCNWFFLT